MLQDNVINYLKSLPNAHNSDGQRAMLYQAGLDRALQEQIPYHLPPAQFFPLLVSILVEYGKLESGQYALIAVLEASKNYIGDDKKAYCDKLLEELQVNQLGDMKNQPLIDTSYDINSTIDILRHLCHNLMVLEIRNVTYFLWRHHAFQRLISTWFLGVFPVEETPKTSALWAITNM